MRDNTLSKGDMDRMERSLKGELEDTGVVLVLLEFVELPTVAAKKYGIKK